MLRNAAHPSLCPFHAREEARRLEAEKLAAEFNSLSGHLNNAIDINHALGKVFRALAQKRISRRDAAAFAYLGQLLLQSVPHVRREVNAAAKNTGAFDHMVRHLIPYFAPCRKQ
jgi:hypothetical protein